MGLRPIENGEYLHEKLAKYATIGDYDIQNGDVVAIFTADNVFVAKYQFIDLCNLVRILAANKNIKYPIRIIRKANEDDGNLFPNYDQSRVEKRFGMLVILGECDDQMLDYLRDGEGAMKEHEIVPGGVYRKFNA